MLPAVVEDLIQDNIVAVITILISAYVARKVVMIFAARIIKQTVRSHHKQTPIDEQKRVDTLNDIVNTALRIGIYVVAGLMILQEVGVNITPLLAGAGAIGLALGFGAQSLVKDAFTGLFIIFENQYRVGDVVMINNDLAGVVERITLRATVMRDLDGMVHHIPNGFIQTATNMTMEYANVNIDIGISYDSDLAKVEKVINKTGEALAKDTEWQEKIIEPPKFLRVDDFADSAITVKILGKTTADARWAVAGEFRKRLKNAFDENDIEIPFPQMVLHDKRESPQKHKK